MNIVKLHSKGYAPATTGGVVYNLEIEVAPDRFNGIRKGDIPYISIVIENRTHEIDKRIVSFSPKTQSFWGEDEELTSEENAIIDYWIKNNKLVDDAKAIVAEDKRLTKELDVLYKKHKKMCETRGKTLEEIRGKTLEEIMIRSDEIEEIGKEIDKLYKQREALKFICA